MTDDATIPKRLLQATLVQLTESYTRVALEILVNIEGQDHGVALDIGVLPDLDYSNPAEVIEYQRALQKLIVQLQVSQEEIARIHAETQKIADRV